MLDMFGHLYILHLHLFALHFLVSHTSRCVADPLYKKMPTRYSGFKNISLLIRLHHFLGKFSNLNCAHHAASHIDHCRYHFGSATCKHSECHPVARNTSFISALRREYL